MWCVVVHVIQKNLRNEEAMTRVGPQRHKKKLGITKYETSSYRNKYVCWGCEAVRNGKLLATIQRGLEL